MTRGVRRQVRRVCGRAAHRIRTGLHVYVMLDRAGRMQLPREYVERLEVRDRVRVALDEDHVSVWPTESAAE